MKLKVKRIQASDIGALGKLAHDFYAELDCEYPKVDEAELEKLLFMVLTNIGNPEAFHLIAYDGKQPAGFFIGNMGSHPYGRPTKIGIAQDLYVVPDKRGRIVGMKLISEAVRLAHELGAEAFEAVGVTGRTDKRWEKLGFKPYVTYLWIDKKELEGIFIKPPKPEAEATAA